jgi:predicted dienelactone hydrolase
MCFSCYNSPQDSAKHEMMKVMLTMTRPRFITARLLKILALAILALIFVSAVFLGYLAVARNTPLQLPAPTGSYPVGRVEFDWVDPARPDPLADQGSSPRELVVWIWFPAAKSGTVPVPYLPSAWVRARDKDQGIGILIESNFNRIHTHSFEGVPLAVSPKTFPILVMEPGMGPMATDYTILAENLASQGYFVVGIHPTYTSNWTVFLDGRVALHSAKGTIPDSDSPEDANKDASRILAVWAQDVTFVIDELAGMNVEATSLFRNRLDLEHIGIWGHSIGGATALAVCQKDPR